MADADLVSTNSKMEVGDTLRSEQDAAPPPTGPLALSITGDTYKRVEWIKREVTAAEKHIKPWRERAGECKKFVAGNQLDDATRAELKALRRPDSALNTTQKYLRYVTGMERRAPQALIFQPAVVDDVQQQILGDFSTNVYEWIMRSSRGNYARSRAFEDMLTTGIGATDKYLDKTRDPRGLIQYVRLPWDELLWPMCQDDNLATTRWRGWESLVDKDEAIRRWPKSAALIRMMAARGDGRELPEQDVTVYTIPYVQSVPIDKAGGSQPDRRDKVKVLTFQWYEDQDGFAFRDPLTKETIWLAPKDFLTYRNRLRAFDQRIALASDRCPHRVVKVSYLLERRYELAEPARLPDDLFTLQFLTGNWDDALRQWYGFVRELMDPQRYANSFLRLALEIFATSTKGGTIAQTDAFKNLQQIRDFEKTHAKPGGVSMVAPEALEKNRIQPKAAAEFPQGAMALLDFCIKSQDVVTGLKPLDGAPADQAATTMRQGQQMDRIILAREFDALSLYRMDEGRSVLAMAKCIADERLIRVGGQFGSKVLPLMRQPLTLEYDLWLDDAEQDPNLRHLYTAFILQAGPMLAKQGLFVPSMLNYLPFPAKVRQEIIQAMNAAQQQKQQAAAQGINISGRGAPRDPRETQARIAKLQADAALHGARAGAVGHESRREDLRAIIEAVDTINDMGHEGMRHRLDVQRHHTERGKALITGLASLMSAMRPTSNGGGEA